MNSFNEIILQTYNVLIPFFVKDFALYFGLSLYMFFFVFFIKSKRIKLDSKIVTLFGIIGLFYFLYLWFPLSLHIPEILNPFKASFYGLLGGTIGEWLENIIKNKKNSWSDNKFEYPSNIFKEQ
ncbi:hypothetical protein [Caminibacter pacificus]|uniref:Uncharacterized protein n=1 Tax=Caminibacter pacificus TaxID=1424653 RepID=A0AAJ4RAX7_9BACT|nr:hypothetical protein [Caminibacter pacificus]QDD68192.1 hypothetical protein C6V80_10075 [Caminibacter pacificus]ROR38705.1 hypothetical protein EDC58_1920 [Caminibacter pacificus]